MGKGEKERYNNLKAKFQKTARRDKKAFLTDQCKEKEVNNRKGKTRDLFKKIRATMGTFIFPYSSVSRVCQQCRRPGLDPWVGKIPWSRKWQPTPVFLPGESHGQRRLAGYSPWGHRE